MKKMKLFLMAIIVSHSIYPCTSIAWNTNLGTFTARTNDWLESTSPKLSSIKKGSTRDLTGYGNGKSYTTKYDIVGIMAYGGLVHDGVNSQGLQVNGLFYRPMSKYTSGTIDLSQFVYGEYLLANFSSVQEVLDNIDNLNLIPTKFDNMPIDIKIHWSITDKSGDRLIIEHDKGGISLYRGKEAMVMTNDPCHSEHLSNKEKYVSSWKDANKNTDFGSIGNTNSYSRFIHASYFLSHLAEPSSIENGLIKLATVPYRIAHDAPYTDMGNGMSGYGTEWVLTQNLNTGDAMIEYSFEDYKNLVKYNFYDLMGKDFSIDLRNEQVPNNI